MGRKTKYPLSVTKTLSRLTKFNIILTKGHKRYHTTGKICFHGKHLIRKGKEEEVLKGVSDLLLFAEL